MIVKLLESLCVPYLYLILRAFNFAIVKKKHEIKPSRIKILAKLTHTKLNTIRNLIHKNIDKHDQQQHVQLMYRHKLTEVVSVPANMSYFFQSLDLTVNREAKTFMKD